MQQEKDFIKREIQRLTIFLSKLIGQIQDTKENGFEQELDQLGLELKNEFDFDIYEVLTIAEKELLEKVEKFNEVNVAQLAQLFVTVADKYEVGEKKDIMIKKALALLNHIDSISNTFSLQRMELKNKLQDRL